jgi:hypothetical protein
MQRRNERVRVRYSRGAVEIPWASRQELLERLRPLDSMAAIVEAFEAVGTNRPVDLSPEQVEALVLALDEWFEDVGRQGLPPKIEELRNALHDDLADEAP